MLELTNVTKFITHLNLANEDCQNQWGGLVENPAEWPESYSHFEITHRLRNPLKNTVKSCDDFPEF